MGVSPVMVTGSSASMSTLHFADTNAGAPERARPVNAIKHACRRIAGSLARFAFTRLGARRNVAAPDERIASDAHPYDVHRGRGQSAIPAAVHYEGGRSKKVHQRSEERRVG